MNSLKKAEKTSQARLDLRENISAVSLPAIAVVFVVFMPFFRTFLPHANALSYAAVILLFVAAAFHVVGLGTGIRFYAPFMVLLLFCLYSLLNNSFVSGLSWFAICGGTALCMVILANDRVSGWERVALMCIALFGLFYALATIVLWIVPDLYDAYVYPYLSSKTATEETTLTGYKAGLTTNYSTNGMYIALGLVACFALSLKGGRTWQVATLVALFALLLTTKRAHLAFGVAAMAAVYFVWGSQKKAGTFAKFLGVAALLLLALYIASFFNEDILAVFERFSSLSDDDSFGGRSGFYELCLSMWGDSPLIGNGWRSFSVEFYKTPESWSYAANGFSAMDAHNVYLQVLAEEGLVGELLFLVVLVGGIVAAVRRLLLLNEVDAARADGSLKGNRSVVAGALMIQLFFAAYCITGNPLYDIQMYVPWLFSIGMAYAATPSEVERELTERRARKRAAKRPAVAARV